MTRMTAASKPPGLLAALFYRDYRYVWISTLGVTTAIAIEQVVISWLVLETTNSATLVGVVAACRFIGMALGPLLGTLADRFDRRHILILGRAISAAYAFSFVGLYYLSLLGVWQIIVLTTLGGILRALDFTLRYVLATDVVDRRDLTCAISLLLTGMGITSVIGPLVGGYLFGPIGVPGTFAIMGGIYLLSSLLLFPVRPMPALTVEPARRESTWKSMIGGIRYIVSDRLMSGLIILAFIANLFAFPVTIGILAVFAREVLHLGSDGFGWLTAAEGFGALIGGLITAGLGNYRYKGPLLIATMILWGVLLGGLAAFRLYSLGLVLLAGSGVVRGISMAIIQVLMLERASEEIRGRVSGIRMFAVVILPLGNVLSGVGASLWGSAPVIGFNALLFILATVITAAWAPEMRRRVSPSFSSLAD